MRSPSPAPQSINRRSGLPTPCSRKKGLKHGPWMLKEKAILSNFINREGEGRWSTLPKHVGLLCCDKGRRLPWMNYLRPSIKHTPIAPDEEDLILRLHCLLGNNDRQEAPGPHRNYWNNHLSKKLISQRNDPRTHRPFNQESSSAVTAPVPYPNLIPNLNEA